MSTPPEMKKPRGSHLGWDAEWARLGHHLELVTAAAAQASLESPRYVRHCAKYTLSDVIHLITATTAGSENCNSTHVKDGGTAQRG